MQQYHTELARALFSFPPPKNVVLKKDKIYFSLDGVVRRALCGLIFSTGAGPVLVAGTSMAVAEVQRVSFGLFAYYHLFQSICNTGVLYLHDCPPLSDTCRGSRQTPLCSLSRTPRPTHKLLEISDQTLKTNDGCL